MRGASLEDWCFLAGFGKLRENLNVYNHDTRSVVVAGDIVPWPVTWVLARYNRKHRWCFSSRPDCGAVRTALASFESKIKWQWWFRDTPMRRGRRVPGLPTPPCPHIVPHELCTWLNGLRSSVFRAMRSSASAALAMNPSNVSKLVRWGLRLMKQHSVVAIPNDKEYGYSLEAREVQQCVHEEILSSHSYQEVACASLNPVGLAQSYSKLCFRVGKLENDTALRSSLLRTLSVAGSTWGASLITAIKTHKGNGFIEHRNIHAAANPKCRGLSFWVSGVLDDELKQLPHLLMSSEHLVSLLPGVIIEPGDKLVRIDLKHFFMSGDVASLSNGASAIVGNRAKHMLVKAVLDFLIFEQFIQSKYLPNRLWRVVKGSGMGLVHSSAVSDACLYTLAERPWACRVEVLREFGVKMFVRFRDDIFAVAADLKKNHNVFSEVQGASW